MTRLFFYSLFLSCFFFQHDLIAQDNFTSSLTGQVLDAESNYPLIGATVQVLDQTALATVTDANGYFLLENVPVGRIQIQVDYLGYETLVLDNVLVFAGKQLQLDFPLQESITALEEIVVTAEQDRSTAVNELVATSSRTLQVEEVIRYAGTLGDVARMAQNYAGVSGATDDRNDVIVRGNSPYSVIWRVEGVDIPSPNHWATLGTTGGPVSLLNTNNLRTSDFLSGAFPAEYGNATGAVFDLKLRNGNPNKYEFLGQIGFNGFEAGVEGPIRGLGQRASFVANYRYSTLGVFNALGIDFGTGFAVPQYQDLNFKINVPTEKAGQFSLWGLGGRSGIRFEAEPDEQNLFTASDENLYSGTDSYVLGFNHLYFFNDRLSSSVSLLASRSDNTTSIEQLDEDRVNEQVFQSVFESSNIQDKYAVNWTLNYKLNAKQRFKAGLVYERYELDMVDSVRFSDDTWFRELDFVGGAGLWRGFAHWRNKISSKLTLNLGLNAQSFDLNQSFSLEPRASLSYALRPNSRLAFAYGRHSQLQPLPIYFSKNRNATDAENARNEQLDFVRSDHFVLSYNHNFKSGISIRTEVYYQSLSGVATDPDDRDFSILNTGASFAFPNRVGLVSEGTGQNYGLELTVDKKLSNGFYFLLTNSLFQSTYEGADGQERNTFYNSNFVSNVLLGKEFRLSDKLVFQLNGRFTYSGGRRFTPIDLEASIAAGEEVRLEDQPFGAQLAPYLRPDLKIGFIFNAKNNLTHSWSVDFQNFINRQNEFFKTYDEDRMRIRTNRQRGFFPDVRYQLLFGG